MKTAVEYKRSLGRKTFVAFEGDMTMRASAGSQYSIGIATRNTGRTGGCDQRRDIARNEAYSYRCFIIIIPILLQFDGYIRYNFLSKRLPQMEAFKKADSLVAILWSRVFVCWLDLPCG